MRLHPKSIDLSLGRVERLLARLGRPERRLPPVVHVAGSNGKGSLIAYLGAMLQAAGYRSHVYTSPHLVRFRERIRLAGEMIEDDALAEILADVEKVNDGDPITFFEITTVAAFVAFAARPADVLLLEVGLGGRLDATNVIPTPLLTAITPISMDHMAYLGETLGAIAGEKAGILKPGTPAVIGPQRPEAARAIETVATRVGAQLVRFGEAWRATPGDDGWRYQSARSCRDLPLPGLAGDYQIDNAAGAIACAEELADFAIDETAIRRGLIEVSWPARLQPLSRHPLAALLPKGSELWLDGGHNEGAAEALARTLKQWAGRDRKAHGRVRPLHLVVGMLNSKEPEDFIRPLAPLVRSLQGVQIPEVSASLSAEDIAAAAARVGLAARPAPDIEAAMTAVDGAGDEPPPRVLVCGSLYLAGRVLSLEDVTPYSDTRRAPAA